ncbi:MAG TPA: penicillin-binding protein 2 [Alphaproteobacteria bacterium]|nr:penicillin-binding protein 2 [Alphaproteobacteria bacterium]
MTQRSRSNPSEDTRRRLIALTAGLVLGFVVLLLRLWYLQVIEGERYATLSENNRIRAIPQRDIRGRILDRHGKVLVDNRPSFTLSVLPEETPKLELLVPRLKDQLPIHWEEVESRLKWAHAYRTIQLAKDLTREQVAYVAERRWDLPGVFLDVEHVRHYKYGELAAHIFGYIGEINEDQLKAARSHGYRMGDYIGQAGIEKQFERALRGEKGAREVEVDALGRELQLVQEREPGPGMNLVLTLDLDLQQLVEEEMAGQAGSIVVIDPRNGEILAMVSKPAYDPNLFVTGISHADWMRLLKDPRKPLQNRTIQAQYPPGSTYKIVMAIAGLEEGVITPKTTVHCNGLFPFGNRVFRDWKRGGHGPVNVHSALVQSCDVFFYTLGHRLGIDTIARYAKGFGLGSPTGLDPIHEKPGLVPSTAWKRKARGEPWYPGETISAAIGQGYNLVTPIQLVNVISAVANGGVLYKPRLVKRLETPDGRVIQQFGPERLGEVPARGETLRIVQQALWGVVNEPRGTAWRARLEQVGMAGKTGTVQVISNSPKGDKLPERFRDHGWFVAYAPYDDPQLAIAILGEHGGRGGSTYAPIARKIVAHYFKLPPTPSPQPPAVVQRQVTRPSVAATNLVSQPVAAQ